MGISEIRTCPHCGVSVSGNTDRCPNCDRKLDIDLSPTPMPTATPMPMVAPKQNLPPDLLPEVLATNPDYKPSHTFTTAQEDFRTVIETESEPPAEPELELEPQQEDVLPSITHDFEKAIGPAATFVPTDYKTISEEVHEPTPLDNLVVSPRPVVQDEADRTYIMPDEPYKTQPAVLSAFGSTAPISPATRVPEPEPLPPLITPTSRTALAAPVPTSATATGPQSVVIPSAPFTPPPVIQPQPQPQYQSAPPMQQQYQSAPAMQYQQYQQPQAMPYQQQRQVSQPSDYWLQQRVYAYQHANYKLEARNPYEALLSQGKSLPFLWWLVALGTGFGALWYFMILLTSGFKRDKVYIGLEPEGYVFEEGAGAAHVRLKRARSGRRWGLLGIVLMVLSALFLFLLVMAAIVISNRYEDAIQQAFPEYSLFESSGTSEELPASEVQDARVIVLVMIILTSTAALGVVGGFMLAVISYIQAAVYRVTVPALPGYD